MRNQTLVRRTARGVTLVEMTVAMAILGTAFVGISLFMNVMVNGLYSETIESDQQTRTAGKMYDILAELRQATAQSPNFHVVTATSSVPSSITFDLPASTNPAGNVVWGSKVTYRLALNSGQYIDSAATVQDAMIMRDALDPVSGTTTTTVIEQHVPYKITENSVPQWGFNVTVNTNVLTIAIRRSGDTNVNLGTTVTATGSTQGTLATAIFTGTYYLRNSQTAMVATQ